MGTLDLERLRIRETYFVPIKKNDLAKAIFDELNRDSLLLFVNNKRWTITGMTGHGNNMCFETDIIYTYLLLHGKTLDHKETGKLLTKIDKLDSLSLIKETIGKTRDCNPDTIFVKIVRGDEKGCEIEVECLPNLYRRVSQLSEKNVDDVRIQDANITCKRFLETTFVGGLSGTIISQHRSITQRQNVEILINDVSTRQITEKIDEMLNEATGEVLIFGYMGTILLKRLRELKHNGINIKLITGSIKAIRQDLMRREKEKAMKELISTIGKNNISIKPEFHGRVVIVDDKALVGSMDLDSYSLTGTRIEFATYTENPEIVRRLRNYFNRIFVPWEERQEQKEGE